MNSKTTVVKVFVLVFIALMATSLACSLSKNGGTTIEKSTVIKTQPIELTANELLTRSSEAIKDVKTLYIKITITSGSGGISIEINGEGVVEQPDKSYIEMNVFGQTIEMLMLSETEVYIKQPGSTNWEQVSLDQLNQVGGLSQVGGLNIDVIQQLGVIDFANNTNLGNAETIDGVDSYHITFNIDMEKYLSQLGEFGTQIDVNTAKGTGELWVGKVDYLPRKFLFNLDASIQGVTINASTLLTLSKFNQPVDIPSP